MRAPGLLLGKDPPTAFCLSAGVAGVVWWPRGQREKNPQPCETVMFQIISALKEDNIPGHLGTSRHSNVLDLQEIHYPLSGGGHLHLSASLSAQSVGPGGGG